MFHAASIPKISQSCLLFCYRLRYGLDPRLEKSPKQKTQSGHLASMLPFSVWVSQDPYPIVSMYGIYLPPFSIFFTIKQTTIHVGIDVQTLGRYIRINNRPMDGSVMGWMGWMASKLCRWLSCEVSTGGSHVAKALRSGSSGVPPGVKNGMVDQPSTYPSPGPRKPTVPLEMKWGFHTVDGSEIPRPTTWDVQNPVNNG